MTHRHASESLLFVLGFLVLPRLASSGAEALAVFFVALFTGWAWLKIPLADILRRMRLPCVVILVGVFPLLFTIGLKGGIPTVSLAEGGVALALLTLARALAALCALMPFLAMEGAAGMVELARRMRLPGFLVEIIWHMAAFIEIFMETIELRQRALEARAGGLGGLAFRVRAAGLLAGGVWSAVCERAEVRVRALAARGGTLCPLEIEARFRPLPMLGLATVQVALAIFLWRWP